MKTSLLMMSSIALFVLVTGCSKEDTPPVLSLIGDQNYSSYYGETFSDPGARATDNEDGDITGLITVAGTVGTAPNIYTLDYSVIDADGNYESIQRYVTVKYKSTSLAGTYNVTETSPFGTVTYAGSVTADSVDFSHFVFGSLSAPDPIVVDASITDRDDISIISVVQGGPITQFEGDITDPGNITFELSYLRPINSTTTNCTATWVKQ